MEQTQGKDVGGKQVGGKQVGGKPTQVAEEQKPMNAANTAPMTKTSSKSVDNESEWEELALDRELILFNAMEEAGIEHPTVEGWLLGEERIKEASDDMPAFDCLLIRLTHDFENVDKDGEKYLVQAGTDVCVPKTAKLAPLLDIARHPTQLRKIRITPTEKMKLGGVKKLRKYGFQLSKVIGDRVKIAPLSAAKLAAEMASGEKSPPALAPAPFE